MKRFILPFAAIVMLGAGCSPAAAPESRANPRTPPPQTSPQTQAPTPAVPTATAKVKVKMSGSLTKDRTYDARCAAYFPAENKGVVFEARNIDGWWLQLADPDKRTEGEQANPTVVLNGPDGSFGLDQGKVVFGPGLRSATIKGKLKKIYKETYIDVDATFTCE